jgi:hypothetical protein
MFLRTLKISTPASRPGRATSTITHHTRHACVPVTYSGSLLSCSAFRPLQRRSANPGRTLVSASIALRCASATPLRGQRGDQLESGPYPHLTSRLTGALGDLLKSLKMDEGASGPGPLECCAASPATACTGRWTSESNPSLALVQSATLSAEGVPLACVGHLATAFGARGTMGALCAHASAAAAFAAAYAI